MRLFIAINFDNNIKDKINHISKEFSDNLVKGNVIPYNNYHITIIFLGEVNKSEINKIKYIIDRINIKPFRITINGLSNFKKADRELIYLKVKQNNNLKGIYNTLYYHLKQHKIPFDEKAFMPHITLFRNAILHKNYNIQNYSNNFHNFNYIVNSIEIMKSEKINNEMVYTAIYLRELE